MEEFGFLGEAWMEDLVDALPVNQMEEPEPVYGAHVFSFEKLLVWNKAINLVEWIYQTTDPFPGEEKFLLTSQIRRSAISIPSNIAEGSGRSTMKDRIHFLNIAYSSGIELLNHLIIAFRLKFLTMDQFTEGRIKIQEITAMLFALKKSWGMK